MQFGIYAYGKNFIELKAVANDVFVIEEVTIIKDLTVSFPEQKVRFLIVAANAINCLKDLPARENQPGSLRKK